MSQTQTQTQQPKRYDSDPADRSRLAQPLTFAFSGRTSPNRFMKAAMTEQLSTFDMKHVEKRGVPTKNLVRCYERWSKGGIGLILSGNVMIFPDHLESIGDPVIPPNDPFTGPRFDAFAAVAAAGKAHGSLMVAQVSHPGRLTVFQESPVSASDVAVNQKLDSGFYKYKQPHPASRDEIAAIVDSFAHAAEYLSKAGWDGIELHGAHGFLLAQFLSPVTNKRTDEYGGSLENRMRLVMEIGREVRRRTPPNFILGIKINSTEFQDTGFLTSEAKTLSSELENIGVDFIELSGGSYEKVIMTHQRESTKKREAFFLEFADQIVPGLKKTKVFVTGGLRTVGGCVRALDTVDGVGIGRPLCDEWHLCKDMMEGKVDGSIITGIDPGDFWLYLMAGNRNMRLVGMGAEPLPLWKPEVVAELKADYKDWAANKSTEKELGQYQAIDAKHVN